MFTETKDKASPVLIAVTLGQEQHETDASSQHHYDSHNFIDWQFSEPVEFENYPKNGISQIDSVDTSANSENIQATATFGKITNQGNGFVVAGLGSFSSGKITMAQIREIAEMKMPDLNAASIEAAMSMIAGTARSMGVVVGD